MYSATFTSSDFSSNPRVFCGDYLEDKIRRDCLYYIDVKSDVWEVGGREILEIL